MLQHLFLTTSEILQILRKTIYFTLDGTAFRVVDVLKTLLTNTGLERVNFETN